MHRKRRCEKPDGERQPDRRRAAFRTGGCRGACACGHHRACDSPQQERHRHAGQPCQHKNHEQHDRLPVFEVADAHPVQPVGEIVPDPAVPEFMVQRGYLSYQGRREQPDHRAVAAPGTAQRNGNASGSAVDRTDSFRAGREAILAIAIGPIRQLLEIDPEGAVQHHLELAGERGTCFRPIGFRQGAQVESLRGRNVIGATCFRQEVVDRPSRRAVRVHRRVVWCGRRSGRSRFGRRGGARQSGTLRGRDGGGAGEDRSRRDDRSEEQRPRRRPPSDD